MQRADIEAMLPAVIRRGALPGSPLDAVVSVMEALHAPVEGTLRSLGDTFHPYRCPERFVPFLAGWVDLDRFLSDTGRAGGSLPTGSGRLRQLVADAAVLSKRSGTVEGFVQFLETATGVAGFTVEEDVVDDDGAVRPFVVRLHVPAAALPYLDLVQRIVDSEKPAYLICEVIPETATAAEPAGG
jgi:phage tail-like protein